MKLRRRDSRLSCDRAEHDRRAAGHLNLVEAERKLNNRRYRKEGAWGELDVPLLESVEVRCGAARCGLGAPSIPHHRTERGSMYSQEA